MRESSSQERISWTELLDILTESDWRSGKSLDNGSRVERELVSIFQRDGYDAAPAPRSQNDYDLRLYKSETSYAVRISASPAETRLVEIERFLEFLGDNAARMRDGLFVSLVGFTPAVRAYLREENITNLRLAVLRGGRLIWETERAAGGEAKRSIYIGVFTGKGGVGKTTVAAHLAGAFALNGSTTALLDLDRQQNLRKMLGESVYLPPAKGRDGSVAIPVFSAAEWDVEKPAKTKIVVCDCSPEIDANPPQFVRQFDYCLMPTTLNPLGINQDADVMRRSVEEIRQLNEKTALFALINNLHADEPRRNARLNADLKERFQSIAERDARAHYIDPHDAAIRFSKQLHYWGFHIFENAQPQLAFRSVGSYSHPRLDFLKLADYLERQMKIQKAKEKFFTA